LIYGKIIAKIANMGSKNGGLILDFCGKCIILKKISIGKRPFIQVSYTSLIMIKSWGVLNSSESGRGASNTE
jgi:hypothetical protein